MTNQLYCNVCKKETPHIYKGSQTGIPGKHLDIYDCLACRDTCGRWVDDEEDPGIWGDCDMGLVNRLLG